MVAIAINNLSYVKQNIDISNYRACELQYSESTSGKGSALFDITYSSQMEAGFGLGRTLFVSLILLIGAINFQRNSNKLVIEPIVDMIKMIK